MPTTRSTAVHIRLAGALILVLAALLGGACSDGEAGGGGGDPGGDGGGDPAFPGDTYLPWAGGPAYYASWSRGVPADQEFFPIAVWLQAPQPNGAAYAAIGVNTFVGLSWGGLTEENVAALAANQLIAIDAQEGDWSAFIDAGELAGWAHQDEPDNAQPLEGGGYGACVYPDEIETRSAEMRANDPDRPIYLNLGRAVADPAWPGRGDFCSGHDEHYPAYVAATDIASFDVYPVNSGLPLSRVADGVEHLRAAGEDARPVWAWIESTRIDEPNQAPSPDQIRTEVWMALVHGAMGFGYFCHVFSPTFIEAGLLADGTVADAIGAIDARVADLAAVLNTRSVGNGVEVESSSSDVRVDVMLKRHGGATYLFAVAMDEGPTTASFALRDFPPDATAEVLDEGREIPVSAGAFADELAGPEAHLYRITY